MSSLRRSSRISTSAPKIPPGRARISKPSKTPSGTRSDSLSKKESGRRADGNQGGNTNGDGRLAEQKWLSWKSTANSSPFPSFTSPTESECEETHSVLNQKHRADVEEEFRDPNTPETIPHVLDAMVVAVLSQATSWSNAKRAMNSMKVIYGSVFAYEKISAGGRQKLEDAIRCGGLHKRKSLLIYSMLQQVRERRGCWDLDHLFDTTDEEAMQELLSYKGIGPKCAFVVMGWCLKRNPFTVDTHVYRIAGLWGWIPEKCTREKAQAHLDARIPQKLKFDLHFLLIAHGRACSACRGGSKSREPCEDRKKVQARLRVRGTAESE